MSRFALLVALMIAVNVLAQPARDVVPPPDVLSPSATFYSSLLSSPEWKLLGQPTVQQELALSASQKSRFAFLSEPMLMFDVVRVGTLGLVPPIVTRERIVDARRAFLETTLSEKQRTRLKQVAFQLKEREFGAHIAFAMSARELGLRADQLEDVTSIKGQRVEDIAKLVTSGERFDKVKPKVEVTNGETYEKMAEMLTRTQRERLKEMKGKAFGGKVNIASPITVAIPDAAPLIMRPPYPPELFGYYDFELRYLANLSYRKELEVTNAQNTAIQNELEQWEEQYKPLRDGSVGKVANLHDRTAKALDTILTAKQRKRFDELMARRRLNNGGYEAASGYPSVVAALKISPVQLSQLKEGKSVSDVLTKSQSDTLSAQLGKPFEVLGLSVADPIASEFEKTRAKLLEFERQIQDGPRTYARRFLFISNWIKLSDEQTKKLREIAEDEPKFFELIQRELSFNDSPSVTGAGRSFTPAAAVAEQYRAAVQEQCWNVLDEKQQSIARQIYGRRK